MKNFFVIAVIVFFGLAAFADNGKNNNQGNGNSQSGQSSNQNGNQNDRDEHGRKHMKFTQDGEFASVATSITGGSINVNVSRGSSSTSPTSTLLNFTMFQISSDSSTQTVTQIFGEIPNTAFTGTTTKSLVLDLDTSTLDPATSSSTTCTIDIISFTVTCGPATVGTIHLEFQENGVVATRILNQVEEDITGPVTTLIHRTSDNGTANVVGSLFGIPVSSAAANVGVNFSSSVEFTRQ